MKGHRAASGGKRPALVFDSDKANALIHTDTRRLPPNPHLGQVMVHKLKSRAAGGDSLKAAAGSLVEGDSIRMAEQETFSCFVYALMISLVFFFLPLMFIFYLYNLKS